MKDKKDNYSSLEELRADWGLPPVSKRTKDLNKLKGQQDRFYKRHTCSNCSKPLTYVGGNIMVCTNESCRGIKSEFKDKEGNTVVRYYPSFELLDTKGADIASNIL